MSKAVKRIVIPIDEETNKALINVQARNPLFSRVQILSILIRYADEHDYLVVGSTIGKEPEGKKKVRSLLDIPHESKEDWCTAFGGVVKDGVCEINKYEVLFNGQVTKNARLVPIKAIPDSRMDFKNDILGGFESVMEAEEAFKSKGVN